MSYKASSLFKNRLSDKSLAKKISLNLTLLSETNMFSGIPLLIVSKEQLMMSENRLNRLKLR